jgi:hypothetical protein
MTSASSKNSNVAINHQYQSPEESAAILWQGRLQPITLSALKVTVPAFRNKPSSVEVGSSPDSFSAPISGRRSTTASPISIPHFVA